MYIIFASYGNDSIALIQWSYERALQDVHVSYSDTGWAAEWWPKRVEEGEKWVRSLGFTPHQVKSEGMVSLAKRKKAWPRGGGGTFQFCTKELKKIPAMQWMDEIDPDREAICMVGIRREESRNRATFPEWAEDSQGHGGRRLWAPLVDYTRRMRDELILKTPFLPLSHRSKECWPCVNCNKGELKLLEPSRVDAIERLEVEMGTNSKGNERVLFSPARHNGAIGIRAVVEDAKKNTDDLFAAACDEGWCGD